MSTKKEQIVKLLLEGYDKSTIAKMLDTQYSYVWSIAKKADAPTKSIVKKDTISQQIRDLSDQGYDRSFISKKLRIDYSFVHNILKRHKEADSDEQEENVGTTKKS